MRTTTAPASCAITRWEVLAIVAAIVLLVAALLPMMPARVCCAAHGIACQNNLKQIGLSFKIWAADNGDRFPMRVSVTNGGTMELVSSGSVWPHLQVLSNELNTPKVINCSVDAVRFAATNWVALRDSDINYFIGVDSAEDRPTMLLAGDDNLMIEWRLVASGLLNLWTNSAAGWTGQRHEKAGNVCFADGSVQRFSNARLRAVLANSGVPTNRLAIP